MELAEPDKVVELARRDSHVPVGERRGVRRADGVGDRAAGALEPLALGRRRDLCHLRPDAVRHGQHLSE
jgi:hypothetical protein